MTLPTRPAAARRRAAWHRRSLAGLLSLFLPAVAWAQATWEVETLMAIEPQRYTALRANGPIALDGAFDEPSWQAAPWTRAFVDIEGDARPAPRFRTRAKMLWDDESFYVAALVEDPDVWATLLHRDDIIFRDNDFEVFMDPDWDTHNYIEYEVNAFATEWDLLLVRPYRDGAPALHEWDIPGLRTATKVYGTINKPGDVDEGWAVEIAFPWEGMQRTSRTAMKPHEGDVWRVNFSRVEWLTEPAQDGEGYVKIAGKSEDNWVWSPQGLVNMHFPEQWGYVRFADRPASPDADTAFALPPADAAYRLLREIYWRERKFRQAHERYTASLDTLGVPHRILHDFLWPPSLEVTDYGYEAWLEEVTDLDGDGAISRWVLTQDSRVQKVAGRQLE